MICSKDELCYVESEVMAGYPREEEDNSQHCLDTMTGLKDFFTPESLCCQSKILKQMR